MLKSDIFPLLEQDPQDRGSITPVQAGSSRQVLQAREAEILSTKKKGNEKERD